jgi:hypothetical protein
MSKQKLDQKERTSRTKVENRIEEIRTEIEEILERLDQIEVEETWVKTWRTRRE